MPEAPPSPAPPGAVPPEVDLAAAGRTALMSPDAGEREEIADIIGTPPASILRSLLYGLAALLVGAGGLGREVVVALAHQRTR